MSLFHSLRTFIVAGPQMSFNISVDSLCLRSGIVYFMVQILELQATFWVSGLQLTEYLENEENFEFDLLFYGKLGREQKTVWCDGLMIACGA